MLNLTLSHAVCTPPLSRLVTSPPRCVSSALSARHGLSASAPSTVCSNFTSCLLQLPPARHAFTPHAAHSSRHHMCLASHLMLPWPSCLMCPSDPLRCVCSARLLVNGTPRSAPHATHHAHALMLACGSHARLWLSVCGYMLASHAPSPRVCTAGFPRLYSRDPSPPRPLTTLVQPLVCVQRG